MILTWIVETQVKSERMLSQATREASVTKALETQPLDSVDS